MTISFIKKVISVVREFEPDPKSSGAFTYVDSQEKKNVWLSCCRKYNKKIEIIIYKLC